MLQIILQQCLQNLKLFANIKNKTKHYTKKELLKANKSASLLKMIHSTITKICKNVMRTSKTTEK